MKQYKVHVFTGDVSGGGTDANVFLTVFGQLGDSGERKLLKSETHRNKFERNHVRWLRRSTSLQFLMVVLRCLCLCINR